MINLNKLFSYKSYNTNNISLTPEVLSVYIDNFWNDVFRKITKFNEKHLMLMIQLHYDGDMTGYRTLANMKKVTFSDKKHFKSYITENLLLHTDA